jgi:hypothetical protein
MVDLARRATQIEEYWREMGERAYARGKNTDDCPKHIKRDAVSAWLRGYAAAHDAEALA